MNGRLRLAASAAAASIAASARAVESGHGGIVHPRTGPALSDVALFVCAAFAVFVVRRALRARFRDRGRKD